MIEKLPFEHDLETKNILRACSKARAKLGELKGIILAVPNKDILINTLPLQEAKASSEIENIITTSDDLFRANIENNLKPATKEVKNYEQTLKRGFEIVKKRSLLRNNDIIELQGILIQNNAGFRKQSGTALKNNLGEVIYEPPQDPQIIIELMSNLERYINDSDLSDIDPLIKMAVIHHQFETIHPFYDGNGRIGRIINVLYLVLKELLDLPILYLSRYIIAHKEDYYRLLQEVREDPSKWEEWILFMLKGIEISAIQSIDLIGKILDLLQHYKQTIRTNFPNMYSQDLLNSLFKYPYTKIGFLAEDINKERQTATKYLDNLVKMELLHKEKFGRSNYYFNIKLIDLLLNVRST